MLLLSLPKSEPAGTCRINGKPAEYRVDSEHLEFRFQGENAWDRRRILDAFQDGDLIRYSCDDGLGSPGPFVIVRPQAIPNQNEEFYWLAINGASCAASGFPIPRSIRVRPTPEQLIGFQSRDEQLAVQRFLLTAPITEIDRFMREKMPRKIKSGEAVYIRPDNPEPPTKGATIWDCGPELQVMEADHD